MKSQKNYKKFKLYKNIYLNLKEVLQIHNLR